MTPSELLIALRGVGLMTDIDPASFVALAQERQQSFDGSLDDPFLVMSVLDDVYGFEAPDEQAATRRCVTDRVLVFNEFHETPGAIFCRRLRVFTEALGVDVIPASPHADDPDLPYDTPEELVEALDAALADTGLRPFLVGEDVYAAILVRESLAPGVLPAEDPSPR